MILPASTSPASTPPASTPIGWPLLRLGFRPFYLAAATFAALSIPLWIAIYLGALSVPQGSALSPLLWHAHEMLFAFAATVIIGFLLTAGKAWTGLPTPRGAALGALALLWLLARLAALLAAHDFSYYVLYAALDLALLPIVAIVLLRLLLRAGNRRNLPLAVLLFLLTLANLAFHAAVWGALPVPPVRPLYAALGLIVMIETVMAGRVVPAFTANATPGLRININPRLEVATLSVTALALVLWIFMDAFHLLSALAFAAAALLQLARQKQWAPAVTRDRPILWILHVAYAWISLGFALLALAQFQVVSPSLGVHALAVGATGGLIIGMITRTARGHTGRPLQVSKSEVLAYALVLVAAVLRALVPALIPAAFVPALIAAALAWSAAFVIYLRIYGPWLAQTRLDGKDG